MLLGYRAVLLGGGLALTLLAGCGDSSYSSYVGSSSVTTTTGAGANATAPSTPGFSGAGAISGTNDLVVATASTGNLAVVVGASQTLSITFASSDGLPMTGFGVSGSSGALPAGWSGPGNFVCATVSTGSGCVLNLTYAPAAVDSGTLTIDYVVVDNAAIPRTNGSITVTYAATANDNVVASISPTGQVDARVGGGGQPVAVDFTTDDGNPATNFTLTSDLTTLPAGWSTTSSSLSCAIVSTGNGCQLALEFAPAIAESGTLTLTYGYTDVAGDSKVGTFSIPYFTTGSNDVVATASPSGQVTAAQKTGGQPVSIAFTTDDGTAATGLKITSSLTALPTGWSSAASSFSCASVNTGNGCQLSLRYAPATLTSGTLSLNYAYVDGGGAAKTGVINVPYAATTNDNVVGTPSPSGQVNAVVGMGAQNVSVTFATDDGRPATALQLTSNLAALPAGWSSTVGTLSCSGLDADAVCVLPLSYAPTSAGNGTLNLGYSYKNNAGQAKTGTVNIAYRATTNDSIVGTPSLGAVNVRTGSSTPVTVTFVTNDGNPASALAMTTALDTLPPGWSAASSAFTCATVSAGTACTLSLTYAPIAAATSATLNLAFNYTNDAGFAETTGMVSINYSSYTPYLYVANGASNTLSACPLNIDNSLADCGITGSGFIAPSGIVLDGNRLYVSNDSTSPGNLVSVCALDTAGTLSGCAAAGGGPFSAPTSIAVNPAASFAYVDQNGSLSVCAINGVTGMLSGCVSTAGVAPLTGIALSADGTHAYAVNNSSTLDICQASTTTGALSGCGAAAAALTQAVAVLAAPTTASNGASNADGNVYISTSTGPLYVCPIASNGALAGCQLTATGTGTSAVAVAFSGNTAYVSTASASLQMCPVNSDGTFGACTTVSDPTFQGTAGGGGSLRVAQSRCATPIPDRLDRRERHSTPMNLAAMRRTSSDTGRSSGLHCNARLEISRDGSRHRRPPHPRPHRPRIGGLSWKLHSFLPKFDIYISRSNTFLCTSRSSGCIGVAAILPGTGARVWVTGRSSSRWVGRCWCSAAHTLIS